MNKTLSHFGMTQFPLGKSQQVLWDDGVLTHLKNRFDWLLETPGVGLLTGEPGVGKTAILRTLTATLNPHRYQLLYLAETDFGRLDIYRTLAQSMGLEPAYRRAQLWRDLKSHIESITTSQSLLPVWIIDEAQNLPAEFFRDFPAFLNFAFDSKDLLTVWLVGQPCLVTLLDKVPYAAMNSRIQVRLHLEPVKERERFAQLLQHGFEEAGCQQTLLSDSGIELLYQSSRGIPRKAHRTIMTGMKLAAEKGLNHLPDEILQEAIEMLQ